MREKKEWSTGINNFIICLQNGIGKKRTDANKPQNWYDTFVYDTRIDLYEDFFEFWYS